MTTLNDLLNTDLAKVWDNAPTGSDYQPIPAGDYTMEGVSGALGESRSRKPRYTIKFRVVEGEYKGRWIWKDCYLTADAMPRTKRDLAQIGILDIDDLEKPMPDGRIYAVKVGLRTDNEGNTHNEVVGFRLLRVECDPFAPTAKPKQPPAVEPEPPAAMTEPPTKPKLITEPPAAEPEQPPAIPDYAVALAKVIPIGGDYSSAHTLERLLPEEFRGDYCRAITILENHGLRSIHIDGTYAYSWDSRPIFKAITTRNPEAEREFDEFFGRAGK
jgi:hypothetical protein